MPYAFLYISKSVRKNTIPREGAVRQEERDLARETKVASIQAAHAFELDEVRSEVGVTETQTAVVTKQNKKLEKQLETRTSSKLVKKREWVSVRHKRKKLRTVRNG